MSYYGLSWSVEIGDEFKPEFFALHEDVRTEILALARLLQQFGPQLGRPRADRLNGSRHANMKELRFSAAGGEWRVAFAFDTRRKGILPIAGDKSGAVKSASTANCSVRPTTVSTPIWPGWKGRGDNHAHQRGRHN